MGSWRKVLEHRLLYNLLLLLLLLYFGIQIQTTLCVDLESHKYFKINVIVVDIIIYMYILDYWIGFFLFFNIDYELLLADTSTISKHNVLSVE